MRVQQIALVLALTTAVAALPFAGARAQYAPPPCSPFPLFWPFCAAGAVVYGAATIVTAPVRAITGWPYGYYGRPYPPPPYYGPPAYYPPNYGQPQMAPQQPQQ